MTAASLVFWIFAAVSTIYVIHFGIYLASANLYDVWQFRRLHRHRSRAGHTRIKRPLVTVLVPAHNEVAVIERCLESIRKSTYRILQVIVVDDASTDGTAAIVDRYIADHPSLSLQVVSMPRNVGKARALNHALEHYAAGKFVMTLDADSIISRQAIASALTYFDDPHIVGVAANVRIIDEATTLGVLQRLEHMISYRSKKTFTLTNCEFVVGGVASTYRMKTLRAVQFYDTDTFTEDIGLSMKVVSHGNRQHRVVYAADVTAMTEGVATFRALLKQRYRWKYGSLQNIIKYHYLFGNVSGRYTKTLTFYRMPMAILGEIGLFFAPLIWGYVIYLTMTQFDLQLLLGAYLTITGYTLMVLWFDEHCRLIDKLRLSLYAPIAYFVFYIMDVVQFVAIVRCVVHLSRLADPAHGHSTWISPERVGKKVIT